MLLGGVCAKSAFSKKKFFLREDFFETNLNLHKHPQQVFFYFFPVFFLIFFQKNNPHILEELRQLCAKFHDFSMKIRGETRVQSWTILALFFRKRIVHCQKADLKESAKLLRVTNRNPVRWKVHGHAGNARRKVIKNLGKLSKNLWSNEQTCHKAKSTGFLH